MTRDRAEEQETGHISLSLLYLLLPGRYAVGMNKCIADPK